MQSGDEIENKVWFDETEQLQLRHAQPKHLTISFSLRSRKPWKWQCGDVKASIRINWTTIFGNDGVCFHASKYVAVCQSNLSIGATVTLEHWCRNEWRTTTTMTKWNYCARCDHLEIGYKLQICSSWFTVTTRTTFSWKQRELFCFFVFFFLLWFHFRLWFYFGFSFIFRKTKKINCDFGGGEWDVRRDKCDMNAAQEV